ncbi:hypothetical protein KHM83_09555 [Fusibacter paucivorans]|uniref:Uncharacterized protein n=1 Tax=Fusibacter paucivorans TaxID=76009 RepID=A0ABS5PPD4_9FIRM|nr:hypothetical protein [Fusibacter paucivorans]MBS7526923.1 hypothetical protein [Fusibacter paucivorans]
MNERVNSKRKEKSNDICEYLGVFLFVDERDELIKLAIEKQFSLEETQRLLNLSDKGKLYPRFIRDAVIIHAISKMQTVAEVNVELKKLGERKI